MSRVWDAIVSDVALHGFSYLGVLLTFIGVLGFLLFAFADLPDASQPFVELFIAMIFFGWAWVLRRQDAEHVADGMELVGGLVLPLIVFAGLVDNAPIPPDFQEGALVAALTVTSVLLALGYAWFSARHPDSILRYIVARAIEHALAHYPPGGIVTRAQFAKMPPRLSHPAACRSIANARSFASYSPTDPNERQG
jgi:hypothetical protein